ncbi:MAG: winged helix-turn-helix domain-containing protein [Candidatus Bathyarchaeota archaeon]|jgi:hypothetical protein|nr:winged helix-turn-helix domain-containing protein [Candidatus Bathyarchaeota archaeon]|tara:strand:+ start:444 stop:929 length:486 start_codon:yes stop_codon:yes gene_type:complete
MEKIMAEQNEKYILGKYYTPRYLVDLIISLCVDDNIEYVLDPSCGTGNFITRMYSWFRQNNNKLKNKNISDYIWGFDIDKKAIEVLTNKIRNMDDYPLITDCFPEISEEELKIRVSTSNKWENRIQWVRFVLIKKGEMNSPKWGIWGITDLGRKRVVQHTS